MNATNAQLGYGKTFVSLNFDGNQFEILATGKREEKPLSDVEIGAIFDNPIDSQTLEEIIQPDETVLLVVPDATRASACGQIVNLLVRRFIANGTMPFNIRIIFATGIHRLVTNEEKKELLTPFIFQRIKTLDHHPRDLMQLINLGETQNGIKIELNRALKEHDHIILVGGISFHYFAGFGGGRKLICPGLASSKTVNATHKLAFDFERKARRTGVGTALLEGNAVHEVFEEVAEIVAPSFAVNSIVNEQGEATRIFCGNRKTSFYSACEFYAENHSVKITEKRDLVIVSGGGFPHDINLVQAHKALEMASLACNENGTIIWLAECADGLGRPDFLDWFDAENTEKLAEMLREKYQVNGQTAWSLMSKLERFKVILVSNLPENETRKMRLKTAPNLDEALKIVASEEKGYIMPFGAKFLPLLS